MVITTNCTLPFLLYRARLDKTNAERKITLYQVLLVDDERHARAGLRDFIPWAQLGLAICAEADDGDTALPLVEQLRPDILITDIKMRRMDGIALSERAKALLPGLKIVFLSGYNDTEYLRKALRMEAVDYIYKPATPQEVGEVMGRIVKQLDEQRSESEKYQRLRQTLNESMPLLREQFLHEWLDGLWDDMNRIRRQVEFLQLALPANKAVMPVLFSPEDGGEGEAAAGYLTASMRQYIQSRMPGAAVCAQSRTVVALASYEDYPDRQSFARTLEDICAYIHELHGVCLAVCVGNPVDDWAEVPASLQQAYDVLENRLFSNEDRILYCDAAPEESPAPGPKLKPGLLTEAIHAGNEALADGMLEDIRQEVINGRMTLAQARIHMMSIALITEMELSAMGAQPADAPAFVKEALGMLTYEGIHRGITALMKTAFENIRRKRTAQYDRTVVKVCDIIRQRYSARLTIEALAQEVHYSPAYLSELFRQETGQTIGNFMLKVRMEKAMERLAATRDSIFQIAEDVGYAEQTHFTRLFKRYTGMTPLEYRKKVIL